MKEQEIRRQFRAAVNIQNKQYKLLKEQLMTRTSKADQKAMLAKLKEEQDRRLSMLSDQYEQSISEVKQHQHVSEDVHFYYRVFILSVFLPTACHLLENTKPLKATD